jgi:aminopeptidase-like protein
MASSTFTEALQAPQSIGFTMHQFISELYPICRSITGDGLRATLKVIRKQIPLEIHEVPTGTQVFDWTVPKEWNIRDAYVKNSAGERVIDFRKSNLHVVNYSVPVRARMSLAELRPYLHSLPEHPEWIPYRTSYYKETWGFCLSYHQLISLQNDSYEVCVDSSLEAGHLSYGECYLRGRRDDEVLISCHACHPSLCNDNLSGIAVGVFLARALMAEPRDYSYRFLFVPGTIGAITWLARNQQNAVQIKHGLVLACIGDPASYSYKKSRRGDAEIDRAAEHVLRYSGRDYQMMNFSPYGYDERQYCSPGFNLPVGCLSRTPWGRFPEYHTSADDLNLVRPEALEESLSVCRAIVSLLEHNRTYVNQNPYCEPQLGKRGLYRAMGGNTDIKNQEMAMLWLLNSSDGEHTLLDIAERSNLPFSLISNAADVLEEHDLLRVKSA